MKELISVEIEPMKIMVDNLSIIMLSKNSTHHNGTTHINTCYHFIGDCIDYGKIVIKYVKTKDQLVDFLTKTLGRIKFLKLCEKIGAKKAWDEVRIKEEHEERDYPPYGSAITCSIGLSCRKSGLACVVSMQLLGAIVPVDVAHKSCKGRVDREHQSVLPI